MKNMVKLFAAIALLMTPCKMRAQGDDMQRIMDSIDHVNKGPKEFVTATFKTTRNINLQTTETVGRRSLDYRISHRFGDINSGANNAWGVDGPANLFMSLEYSYDGRLMAGLGRSALEKMAEGFLKFRLIRQTSDGKTPLSVTLFSSMNYTAMIDPNKAINGFDKYKYRWDRFSYANQIIIGRKFNKRLSLEIAPTMIHYNLVDLSRDKNDMYALGFAGRYKITNRMAITAEYVWRINKYSDNFSNYNDCAGVGLDIETGGHVFQIIVTNAFGMDEVQFVPYTQTSWKNAGIRLGFNLSRVFTVGH
ncbi:MAG TPA: DUF5777 family beta-barrel protein [Bacteroidia bacterium]|jgi:hypothetical protein